MTRSALALLLVAIPLSLPARAQTPASPAGCGDPAVQFDVELDRGLHPAPATPGRALVFFVEDDTEVSGFRKPTLRVGLDGKWVGATHGDSYIFFYVEPGRHHLCSNWQDGTSFARKGSQTTAGLEFTAQAGETYFFQMTNTFHGASRTATTLTAEKPSNVEDYLADYRFAFFHQLP